MPDWNRMIVGDAFRVKSRDPNYYRDLFLFWPFWGFMVSGITKLFSSHHDYRAGLLFSALGLLSLMLARERFFLVVVGLGFCAVQGLLAFGLKHDWAGLELAILTGMLCLAAIFSLRDHKMSYRVERGGPYMADLLVGVSSLALAIFIARWIGR